MQEREKSFAFADTRALGITSISSQEESNGLAESA